MILKDKHILITGGASGIGKALAKYLIEQEVIVTILDSNKKSLEETYDTFKTSCILCDVSKQEEAALIISELAPVDVLVNNAAVVKDSLLVALSPKGFTLHSLEDWKSTIETNLNGVFYITRAIVEKMIRKRIKGLILNVSSITAVGNQGQSAYSASKAAIDSLTVTWAKELSNFQIRVAGIAPGFVDVGLTSRTMNESLQDMWIKRTLSRRLAKVEEIVQGMLFIIENDFYNGRTLQIDGGLRL